MSVSGGVEFSPERGRAVGCDVIQIFSKNQRQWAVPPLSEYTVQKFRDNIQKYSIQTSVIHDSYLINLASSEPEIEKKSRQAFLDEIERADALGVPFLVFHPGAYKDSDPESGMKRIAGCINRSLEQTDHASVILLLENTAGQGTSIGSTFEELAWIIGQVHDRRRVGVCLDTAHAFAAGYDMRDEKTYEQTLDTFDRIVGLNYLKLFHLNDSKTGLGSRVDRHENPGKGNIGLGLFRTLVNDSRFQDHPMILETPGGDAYFRNNLILLRSLISKQDAP